MPAMHPTGVRVADRLGQCVNCTHPAPSPGRGWIESCLKLALQPTRRAEIVNMDMDMDMDMDYYTGLVEFCRCRHLFHGP